MTRKQPTEERIGDLISEALQAEPEFSYVVHFGGLVTVEGIDGQRYEITVKRR